MAAEQAQILIITGHDHFHHRWRESSAYLRDVLERSERFEVRIDEEFTGASRATLDRYDAVLLNFFGATAPGETEHRWGGETEADLFEYIHDGGGLVLYHGSLWAGRSWDDEHADRFWRMAGGLLAAHSRRAPSLRWEVTLDEPDDPIAAGLPQAWEQVNDDKYVNLRWHPEAHPHVIASALDDPGAYLDGAYYAVDAEPGPPLYDLDEIRRLPGVGRRHPVIWTNAFGSGRVYVSALGHVGASTVEDAHEGRRLGRPVGPTLSDAVRTPAFVNLLRRGTEWAATGRTTLPLIDVT